MHYRITVETNDQAIEETVTAQCVMTCHYLGSTVGAMSHTYTMSDGVVALRRVSGIVCEHDLNELRQGIANNIDGISLYQCEVEVE